MLCREEGILHKEEGIECFAGRRESFTRRRELNGREEGIESFAGRRESFTRRRESFTRRWESLTRMWQSLTRRRESFTRTRESLANLFLDKVRLLSGGGLEISQQFFLKTFDVTRLFQN